jgi:hypothetical protein
MAQQTEFMLLFRYQPTPNHVPTEAELTQMHQQWGAFIGQLAIEEKLVSTHKLAQEGCVVHADHSVQEGAAIYEAKITSGNMLLKANNLQEATAIAKKCPILFMGGSVEIRPVEPM